MKPSDLLGEVEADMARRRRVLEALSAVASALREELGVPDSAPVSLTVCPPAEPTRASVRRGRAKATKALRTKSGRRKAAPAGSLRDRILSTLGAFQAPMKKSAVVDDVKAREADVTAELKRLRDDGQVTVIGRSRSARWSLPKFANVVVAEDAA